MNIYTIHVTDYSDRILCMYRTSILNPTDNDVELFKVKTSRDLKDYGCSGEWPIGEKSFSWSCIFNTVYDLSIGQAFEGKDLYCISIV